MNLNKEESEELESCITSAKVMYFSQAIKNVLTEPDIKIDLITAGYGY